MNQLSRRLLKRRKTRPRGLVPRRLAIENLEGRRVLSATGFTVSMPSSLVAGRPELLTVTPTGTTGTVFTDAFTFSSSDAKAALPAPYTFKNALPESFLITLKTVGTGTQTVIVTDNTANLAKTQTVAVTPAAAHGFLVAGLPSPYTAGTQEPMTVTAIDAYGNTATDYAGTVKFASSDPAAVLPADYTFSAKNDDGVHTFQITLETHGKSRSVIVTDTANPLITGTEKVAPVLGGVVGTLSGLTAVQSLPTEAVVAGKVTKFVVTAVNQNGAPFTTYAGTVHFSSSDPNAVLPPDTTFLTSYSGKHTFSVTFKTAGPQTLTVTDTADNQLVATLKFGDVSPGPLAKFLVTGLTQAAAGTSENVTVEAVDAYGNPLTDPQIGGQAVTVIITNNEQFVTRYTFVPGDDGKKTFSITLLGPGLDTVSAIDANSGLVGGKETVMVT